MAEDLYTRYVVPADRRPEPRDAVALLRAGCQCDLDAVQTLVRSTDPILMVAVVAGFASKLGELLYGSVTKLDAALAHWQRTGELPDPPR
jgi:hypothetical protein